MYTDDELNNQRFIISRACEAINRRIDRYLEHSQMFDLYEAIDAELVAPGRLDHLVEVVLPDADAQREILELLKGRTERHAGRPLFEPIDYRTILPVMGGMSGADISEIICRALETKVHRAAEGAEPGSVSTDDLLVSIDAYKRVRGVVEKIRYGQYL